MNLENFCHAQLQKRIFFLDGGMGTMIQSYRLQEEDYRGQRFKDYPHLLKGNNDLLSITQPHIIHEIHLTYLKAGADFIETNSFNSTAISLADYHMSDLAYEFNVAARKACKASSADMLKIAPDKPRFVIGILGPTNRTASISPDVNDPGFRNITFDLLCESYMEATRGLVDGGVDAIMIETIFDTLNCKAAIFAVEKYFDDRQALAGDDLRDDHRCKRQDAIRTNHTSILAFSETYQTIEHWIKLRIRRGCIAPIYSRISKNCRCLYEPASQCRITKCIW